MAGGADRAAASRLSRRPRRQTRRLNPHDLLSFGSRGGSKHSQSTEQQDNSRTAWAILPGPGASFLVVGWSDLPAEVVNSYGLIALSWTKLSRLSDI
jgi:hypothetical protein